MKGYLRKDGRKGIRNTVLVAYFVECAKHVGEKIVHASDSEDVHLIGFSGCYPNAYADKIMTQVCTHPNAGAVLLVSLGCESFLKDELKAKIAESGRPVELLTIQEEGGTQKTIEKGVSFIKNALRQIDKTPVCSVEFSDLTVATICGGSDATSGITANPAVGDAFDKLTAKGGTAIFEETGEMIGLENRLAERADRPELAQALKECVEKAARYYTKMGQGSFAPGNADGGLSTIEEKSLGAYMKSGTSKIRGLIKPGDVPQKPGLYLMDVVPDGEPMFGYPNINDNMEITELIASGAHIVLFTTGRGSVVGSAVSPVIKICANPQTYQKMKDDMDVNAGQILYGQKTVGQVGDEILKAIESAASGAPTKSEALGHKEFVLGYKRFSPSGPGCLPG